MDIDQLESHLAGLFSDFVAPEPDPPGLPGPLTQPDKAATPAALATAEASGVTQSPAQAAAAGPSTGMRARGVSGRVVIMHSHPESARLLSEFFKKRGNQVWQAADFAEAGSLLGGNGQGLLVADWGGLAMLGEIRERFPRTKVLLTDGYPAPQPKGQARASGVSGRVVIMHSHPESARLLSEFFKKRGNQVWQAADFAEAGSLLEGNGQGLLVADWGGLAMLGEIRERFPRTKVLLTDGYPAPQPKGQAQTLPPGPSIPLGLVPRPSGLRVGPPTQEGRDGNPIRQLNNRIRQFVSRGDPQCDTAAAGQPSVKSLILVVGILYFCIYAFMFRDAIRYVPEIMRGDMVIVGDELVPFFNPYSQFIDQARGDFNQLTHGYEFRVRYSILTTWMRYYKVLPFALVLVIPGVTFAGYLAVSRFLHAALPHIPEQTVYRATSAPMLLVFLILSYSKITHFYTLIVGFSMYLVAAVLLIYGILFAQRRPYLFIAGASLLSLFNPAVHYLVLYALFIGLLVAGIVIAETVSYLADKTVQRKLYPSRLWQLVRDRRHRLPTTILARCVGALILLGVLTVMPYAMFVKLFVLNGVTNLSETVPVNYYFIKDASIPFLHLISFDLAGIMDKIISGDYLAKQPRVTNILYTVILFIPLLKSDFRRAIFSNKTLRDFIFIGYGIMLFSFWATLGYSGPDSLPTFHRTIAAISNFANGTQSRPGDMVVKLMGTIVQVLRFPHRFQLIMFLMACIIMPIGMIWIDGVYGRRVHSSPLSRYSKWLYLLLYVLFFVPMLSNWQYRQTFLSGNFRGFLSPYPLQPLREVKEFLLTLPEGKTVVLPPTETAKRIIDINDSEHKFIDKFHIYFLDLPSYYYGLTGDSRNKHEFFLLLRAMYYEQDWWVNIARDNQVRYIVINKELKANTVGGAEYLKAIEDTIMPQMDELDEYFRKAFENESYAVYEFLDLPNQERMPLFIDVGWNDFIRVQSNNLELSRTYDLRYSMIADDLLDYDQLAVITDDVHKTAIDLYVKSHPDQFFRPSSIIFPFNQDIVPSAYYLSPMFRLFQFFSDSKWNRLEMITPGMYGSVSGSFIGVPRETTFRIDATFPEEGKYRILLSGASTVNQLSVESERLGLSELLTLDPSETNVVFFEQDKVFGSDRQPFDVSTYSTEELELMIPSEIVAVNYQFRYIDFGTVNAPRGTHAIYFDKLDNNPLLVEGILVIAEDVYQNLQLPDNVTVLDPSELTAPSPATSTSPTT